MERQDRDIIIYVTFYYKIVRIQTPLVAALGFILQYIKLHFIIDLKLLNCW